MVKEKTFSELCDCCLRQFPPFRQFLPFLAVAPYFFFVLPLVKKDDDTTFSRMHSSDQLGQSKMSKKDTHVAEFKSVIL